MFIRAYLRASTSDQDAQRARADLERFAQERGLSIASWYFENESGAKLERPELFRLLRDAKPGDVLLIEQVDRLSRLTSDDWQRLRQEIDGRQIKIVALDLPTSWQLAAPSDEFTSRVFMAINQLMLDVLAAVARKDYEDRRRRQVQGIKKAQSLGRYQGRPEDAKRNAAILKMLSAGQSWNDIQAATGCSRSTLARLARRQKEEDNPAAGIA
ncbi:recombinase family protein [Oryzifoliimicrobium ureilyticus]|uniref:recombinase family protein n=1 Tax=Oryzifoliimicrobium ureilyticus TaxID=3113724 RepID=UPI0030765B9A